MQRPALAWLHRIGIADLGWGGGRFQSYATFARRYTESRFSRVLQLLLIASIPIASAGGRVSSRVLPPNESGMPPPATLGQEMPRVLLYGVRDRRASRSGRCRSRKETRSRVTAFTRA